MKPIKILRLETLVIALYYFPMLYQRWFVLFLQKQGPFYAFIFLVTGVMIPALSANTLAQQNKTTEAPVFEIDGTKHDFGDLFAGEQATHFFHVRNTGNAPLQMSETPIYPDRPPGPNIEMDFQTRLAKEKLVVVINGKPSPG